MRGWAWGGALLRPLVALLLLFAVSASRRELYTDADTREWPRSGGSRGPYTVGFQKGAILLFSSIPKC